VSSERARLFVALELPASVRAQLARWSGAPNLRTLPLRLIDPESLHVTLCFLGQRPVAEVGEIARACRELAALPAPALSLGTQLWLPRLRAPRVLAVDLADASGAAAAIQSSLAEALQAGGFYQPEKRPFLAHVTVARVRSGERLRPPELPGPEPQSFTADIVTLFASRLGSGPAQYQALERVTLTR
jgi:2'-5' RNA ligase